MARASLADFSSSPRQTELSLYKATNRVGRRGSNFKVAIEIRRGFPRHHVLDVSNQQIIFDVVERFTAYFVEDFARRYIGGVIEDKSSSLTSN